MSSIVRQQDFKGGRVINAILPRHAFEQRPLSSAYKEARESRFTRVLAYAGHSFGSACHDVVAKPERRVRPYEEVDGKMMYLEDIQPGEVVHGPTFTIDRDEMVDFAKRWDPQPFHIDDEAGNAAFGGITAPGCSCSPSRSGFCTSCRSRWR